MHITKRRLLPGRDTSSFLSDREFLAPALSILETPPSPIGTALLLLICALVTVSVLWATLGHISIAAMAPGKIEPQGQVRTVQVLETGRVFAVNATNGSRVREGDVLFTLDPATARLQLDRALRDQASAQAEIARREAEIAATRSDASPVVDWPADLPVEIQQREADVLAAELARLHATTTELRTRIEQQAADQAKLEQTIAAESHLLEVLQQPVAMQQQLQQLGIGARANLVQAQVTQERQRSTLIQAVGQQRQLVASMALAHERLQSALDSFVADQSGKLTLAHRTLDRVTAQVAMARVALDHMTVRATVGGTVQASNITTVGQVFQPGQEAMRIVPDGVPLEVIAQVRNQDIGFIKVGQPAVIKVNAFPFTQYGTLEGRVIQVSTDAVTSADSQYADASPGQAPRTAADQGRQPVLNLVFPVTIALDEPWLSIGGRKVRVSAGMQVSAEIDTGSRRIIDYVLAPVVEAMSSAGKER